MAPERLQELSDSELLTALGKKPHRETQRAAVEIDWAWVSRELARPAVTLALLWQEVVRDAEGSFSYSAFCRQYRKWEAKPQVTLRQVHHPGDKSFVDFSGLKLSYCDPETGEVHDAEIFVGSLGASNLTYVEATPSQELMHWLGAHSRMFAYFGGVTAAIVPDNLKSGVTTACRYEPELNRSYLELAEHYTYGDSASSRQQAAGQGQGRKIGAGHSALDFSAAARRDCFILLPRSTLPSSHCLRNSTHVSCASMEYRAESFSSALSGAR